MFFACSNGEQAKGETLVKINDYDLSFGEFHRQLARELNFNEDLKLTRKVREEFLEKLIQEELLIQEAFRKAIWYFQFRLEIENANKKIPNYFQFNLQYFLSGSLTISFPEMENARHIPCLPAPKATGIPILPVYRGQS